MYSLVAGAIVGVLGSGLRALLDVLGDLAARVIGFRPPGTPGEGGFLQAFGGFASPDVGLTPSTLPWGLLALPILAAFAVWLRGRASDPLEEAVRAYHESRTEPLVQRGRELGASLLAYGSGLAVGRDGPFTALGNLAASVLSRIARLNPLEARTLRLASVGAALGLVLHAPLASALLIVEVLYRRFEFEVEVLLPAVLASVTAYAIYGTFFGFSPLVTPELLELPTLTQVPLYALLGLVVSFGALLVASLRAFLPPPERWTYGRVGFAFLFGLLSAVLVYFMLEAFGDGSGWWQLGLSGFAGAEAVQQGLVRVALLLAVTWLALGGTVVTSLSAGGLLGVGLAVTLPSLGLDPVAAGLVGAAAFLTTSHNVPVAATLLLATWSGDALLPALLAATLLAHAVSGETSIVVTQRRRRADSPAHGALPAPLPLDAPEGAESEPPPVPDEQLYRLPLPVAWADQPAEGVVWPEGVEFVAVVRGGEVQLSRPGQVLRVGDELMVLATPEAFDGFARALGETRGSAPV